ncbi:MAG: hypothetical protein IJP00_03730 [Firmicutes bacterium]|nr:hypothetical protein [Bacillota bacterium]
MAKNTEAVGIILLLLVASGKGGIQFGNLINDVQKLSGILNNMNSLSQLALSGNILENMVPLLSSGLENSVENQNDVF